MSVLPDIESVWRVRTKGKKMACACVNARIIAAAVGRLCGLLLKYLINGKKGFRNQEVKKSKKKKIRTHAKIKKILIKMSRAKNNSRNK